MTKHTPTPWKVASVFVNNAPNEVHITTGKWGQASIAVVDTQEDAELIVRAVNAHEELLEALKYLLLAHSNNSVIDHSGNLVPPNLEAIRQAKQAIAKAEEGK